jgi:hypothetical protein
MLFWHLLGGTEKNHKESVRMVGLSGFETVQVQSTRTNHATVVSDIKQC